MALLTCNKATMSYDGRVVLKDLSFKVNAGNYLCIVGENGSGKSTLMKGILGLLPPAGGSFDFSDGLQQKEIGYLPQQSAIQRDFPASVWEVVMSGVLNKKGFGGFYNRADREKAVSNMEKLNITKLKKRCYGELSGGQQQRVLLARALCATGKLILLDEPVAGLDPIATNDMYEIINDLNRKEGITVIMVSHDIVSAVDHADHILHLSSSGEVFFGSTSDYTHSDLGSRFLFHNCSCNVCRMKEHNHHIYAQNHREGEV
ncbi:MAG TPA: ABC transporter ATP-binding protein [Clostridiales bacterium]|nr:ABC transporter ATP-binding protein [Clostridiales bacterium]